MPVQVTCTICGQSATHHTDAQAWDDIYHADRCSADDVSFPEADNAGAAHVNLAPAMAEAA